MTEREAGCNSGYTHVGSPHRGAQRCPVRFTDRTVTHHHRPSPRLWRAARLSGPPHLRAPNGHPASRQKCGSEVGRCEPRAEVAPPPSSARPAEAGESTPNPTRWLSFQHGSGREMGWRAAHSRTAQFDRTGDGAPALGAPRTTRLRAHHRGRLQVSAAVRSARTEASGKAPASPLSAAAPSTGCQRDSHPSRDRIALDDSAGAIQTDGRKRPRFSS